MGTFEALLGHVIDLEFDTHEAMIEAALLWQIEEYQLDSGTFKGSMNAIHTSHIQMAYTSRANGIFIKGNTPKNAYMFASVATQGKMTHNGLKIYGDELVVLTEDDNLDFIVSSAVDDVCIAIDKDFFEIAFKNYFNEPFNYDKVTKRIQLKENSGLEFRTAMKEILAELMVHSTKFLHDTAFHDRSEQAILQVVFQNIDHSRKRKKVLESEINANEIRNYLEKNYKNDIKVNELINNKNFSKRTIRSGFNNLFGLSPKQYLQCYRLGKIHHYLLKNDHNKDTVGKIAYEHGFSHMGRFSDNYKSMFGKTPYSTLKTTLI